MTDSPEGSRDAALEALVELGRNAGQPLTRTELDAGLTAVRARMATARRRRRVMQRVAVAIALMLPPLVWVYADRWFTPNLPLLTYEIEGGGVIEGGYLREAGRAGVKVQFNEGTRFVLTHGSRGRLRSVDNQRARVGIEHGSALVEVTPDTGRLWEVEAGPFLVTVKGTAFTLSWDPADEQFELRLLRGRVVVSGPVSGGELTLKSGQRLLVSLPQARTVITEDVASSAIGVHEPPPPNAVSVETAPAASSQPPASTNSVPTSESNPRQRSPEKPALSVAREARSTGEKALTARRWTDDLANGRWDAIIAAAEQQGIAAILSSASSEDLFALANAARYRRRSSLAHDALQALRRRYPQSPRALDAVFLLGRVQEARGSGFDRALAWYEEYLAKAPNGAYAAEALGRKMTILNKTAQRNRAKAIAKDYLRRFPEGSHAGSARVILDDR